MTRQEQQQRLLAERPEFAAIAQWVRRDSSVLDLGCGDGLLLAYLSDTRAVLGYGVEIDDAGVLASTRNGVSVIQSDFERGLAGFEAGSFDYVILSQTLQATRHTEAILSEMLRVGREAIVTFPNFGHWTQRLQVLGGRMPVSKTLPYQWYDTPNVHHLTIADFDAFCAGRGIRVLERLAMHDGKRVGACPNLLGSIAVYRLARGQGG